MKLEIRLEAQGWAMVREILGEEAEALLRAMDHDDLRDVARILRFLGDKVEHRLKTTEGGK